jgi:hypothetical protein
MIFFSLMSDTDTKEVSLYFHIQCCKQGLGVLVEVSLFAIDSQQL